MFLSLQITDGFLNVLGFDIAFGVDRDTKVPILLEQFFAMVLTPGPNDNSTSPNGNSTSPTGNDASPTNNSTTSSPYLTEHKYSIEAGLFPVTPTKDPNDPDPNGFPNTGAATEWTVQAGTLQFRIDCDFSLSSAFFVTDEKDPTNPTLSPIFGEGSMAPIYSFPMGDTPAITSQIQIRVYWCETESGVPELLTNFQAAPVMKNAATSLWKAWTKDDDPLETPDPQHLKDPTNPTVPMCQGIRITPPPPGLSQSPVVDFDATAAMQYYFWGTRPLPLELVQTNYLSSSFTSTDPSTSLWSVLADTWAGTGESKNKAWARGDLAAKSDDPDTSGGGMVAMCASLLGWDRRKPTPPTQPPPAPDPDGLAEWQLKSDPPTILISELQYYYPDVPVQTSATST